jgi:phage gpG-like protein
MGLTVTVDASELEELHEKLNRDAKPLMQKLADRFVGSLRSKMAAVSLAPSAATLAIRKRRGGTGSAPLVDMGKMLGSIKARSTKNSAAAQVSWPALALHEGFTTAADSAIPGKVVPARPFVFLEESEFDEAVSEMEAFLLGD